MSERGTRLMAKADSQLSEMIEVFGTLNEADLHKPCPDESAEDSDGVTVGAVAAHMAQGYHFLGKFLQADGYVPGAPAAGNRKGRGHRYRPGHGRTFPPAALPDMVDQADRWKGSDRPAGGPDRRAARQRASGRQQPVLRRKPVSRAGDRRGHRLPGGTPGDAEAYRRMTYPRLGAIPVLTTMRDEGHAHG